MLKKLGTVFVALMLGAAAAGCGDDHGESEDMTALVQAFNAELSELGTLVDSHKGSVDTAMDLNAVKADEAAYVADARGHHDEMHHSLDEMSTCSHEGHGPHTGDLSTVLDTMHDELEAHDAAIAAAADLDAAKAEEARHHGVIDELLTDLGAHLNEAALEAGQFSCPHHDEGNGHN